jgi:hypothetical protein
MATTFAIVECPRVQALEASLCNFVNKTLCEELHRYYPIFKYRQGRNSIASILDV